MSVKDAKGCTARKYTIAITHIYTQQINAHNAYTHRKPNIHLNTNTIPNYETNAC